MRSVWLLPVALLLALWASSCAEEPEFEGEGGELDNPIAVAIRWPYAYVTNANFDLSDDKRGWISVIDLETALVRRDRAVIARTLTTPYLGRIVLSDDGLTAYVTERYSDRVRLFNLTDPVDPREIDMDPGEYGTQGIDVARQPYGLALSPDRRYLWTPCAASGHVSIVDLATDRLAKNISLVNGVSEVAFDPAGRFAYVTNRKFDMISLLDAASGNFLLSFGQGDAIDLTGYDYREMAFTPDGRYLFVAAREPSGLLKIDTSLLPGYPNLAIERVLPMDTGPMSVTVTPDGKEAWVGTYDAHMVIALDVETGASLGSMKSGNGTTDIEIFARPERPDYYYALSVNFASHNLTLFDAMTKEVIWNLP